MHARSSDAADASVPAHEPSTVRALPRWAVPLGCVLACVLVALFASLPGLPYQDVPNHLSRAVAIADLLYDDGARYGTLFRFEWQFVPYILGDALHVATLAWLPPDVAARTWVVLGFLCIPLATWALLRQWGCSRYAIATALAFTLFLASDWFLLLGFLNFRYGLALALLAIVAWERVLERPRAGRWLLYALALVAAYLMHLAAVVMIVAAIGTLSLVRLWRDRARFPYYVAAGLPPLLLFAWHVAFRGGQEVGEAVQPEPVAKVLRVVAPFVPFREPVEVLIALAFLATLAVPVLASRGRAWPWRAWECSALAAAYFAMYLVLPEVQGAVWGVDFRALPFAWLFAVIAVVLVVEARMSRRWLLPAAALALTAAHVAALWPELGAQDALNRSYRSVAAAVPPGATVLPVVTRPRQGLLSPSAHAASFATIDARAVVPYTFSGDQSAPMPYFRFVRKPPPHPDQWWYVNDDAPPSWRGLLEGYDYALVQLPVQWSRVPLRGRVVAGSDAVVLLELTHARARTVHDGGPVKPAAPHVRPRGGVGG